MTDETMRDVLARLEAQNAAQQAELIALRRGLDSDRAGRTTPEARPTGERRPGRGRRRGRRGRLAAVLAVALLLTLVPLSLLAANPFTDLVPGSVHNPDIDLIYNAGITVGCVPDQRYCPRDPVTREQMATFLARTAGLGDHPPVVNADMVDGKDADELVRVARASGATVDITATGDDLQVLTTVGLVAPANGFVLVSATNYARATEPEPACPCLVDVILRDNVSGEETVFYVNAVEASGEGSVSVTYVFPVAAGNRTFSVLVGKGTSAAALESDADMTALYVPFGAGGAETAGTDTPPQKARPRR